MRRLACRFAAVAALLAGFLLPGARAQAKASAPLAVTGVRNFSPAVYGANGQNWSVAEDSRGILFFGNSSGVLEYDGARWRLIGMPGGGGAYAVAKASNGRILVGGDGEIGSLVPNASGTLKYVSDIAGLPAAFHESGDRVIQILDTPAGRVFLSDHWLFVRAKSGAVTSVPSDDHFLHAAWYDGSLYVLDTVRGLTRLEGDKLQGLPGGADVRGLTMVATKSGLLIPSFNQGLVLYQPGSAQPMQVLNAAGWNTTDGSNVTSAVALTPSLVAFGTAKNGVEIVNAEGQIVLRAGTSQGLADPHVYGIGYNHRGGLWAALNSGVSLVGVNLPADAEAAPFRAQIRAVVGTRDDRVVFGGAWSAKAGGVQSLIQDPAQILKFPYRYNAFRIAYAANGLGPSGAMEYQTFMNGVDNGWSKWSPRIDREFTELPHGRWVFQVRARMPDGQISSEATYVLRIKPAWFQTWWFAILQVLAVIGILVLPGHTPHKKLQEALTTFAVIVPFVYLGDTLTGFIEHYYTSEVALVQLLISSGMAFMLDPLQKMLEKLVKKRNARRASKRKGLNSEAHGAVQAEEELLAEVEE